MKSRRQPFITTLLTPATGNGIKSGYRRLAVAMIQQAIDDLKVGNKAVREKAKLFFRNDDSTLSLWCSWMDISKDCVQKIRVIPTIYTYQKKQMAIRSELSGVNWVTVRGILKTLEDKHIFVCRQSVVRHAGILWKKGVLEREKFKFEGKICYRYREKQ